MKHTARKRKRGGPFMTLDEHRATARLAHVAFQGLGVLRANVNGRVPLSIQKRLQRISDQLLRAINELESFGFHDCALSDSMSVYFPPERANEPPRIIVPPISRPRGGRL